MNRGINYQLINSRDITIHDGDVVSSDSTDSEQDMESFSSEFDSGEATRSQLKKKIKYSEFTEHDLKGKIKLRGYRGIRFI
jgi:hypothetical protein